MNRIGLAGAAALLTAAAGALGMVRTATRLDRLHVRTDAAWGALDAALRRRALLVSALASPDPTPEGTGCSRASRDALERAADAALRAGPGSREDAENELSRLLAGLNRAGLAPARAAQLADAEQRVVIARRVYNDAVRDTLALRSHRMVRWLRLAGTSPLPRYFEIAEPAPPDEPYLPLAGMTRAQEEGAGA